MGCTVDFFLFLSHKFVGAFTPSGLLGSHVRDINDTWYHSDNNHYIGVKLKRTFLSLIKDHCFLWLDFLFLDVFSPEDASFVKLKAALDSEVTTKLLAAVLLFKINRLRVIFTMLWKLKLKVEIRTDLSSWPYWRITTDKGFGKLGKCWSKSSVGTHESCLCCEI